MSICRVRERDDKSYALSLSYKHVTKHYKIEKHKTGSGPPQEKLAIEDGPRFDSLMDVSTVFNAHMLCLKRRQMQLRILYGYEFTMDSMGPQYPQTGANCGRCTVQSRAACSRVMIVLKQHKRLEEFALGVENVGVERQCDLGSVCCVMCCTPAQTNGNNALTQSSFLRVQGNTRWGESTLSCQQEGWIERGKQFLVVPLGVSPLAFHAAFCSELSDSLTSSRCRKKSSTDVEHFIQSLLFKTNFFLVYTCARVLALCV